MRIDPMDQCGHYARWEDDFRLVKELGIDALRYAPAYHRIHTEPDYFDWELADEPMQRLQELGIEVIADLCRFGAPSWLGGFHDAAFPVLFANYARAFARRYSWIRYFTPINEISVCASASALHGWWNGGFANESAFARALRNLCMAHELAVEAILAERPDAIIVQSESLEHFHPTGSDAEHAAERWNGVMSLALDLTLGHELAPGMARFLHENGVTSNDLSFFREKRATGHRWLGLNYTAAREHCVSPAGHCTNAPRLNGFAALATHWYRRYTLPLFYSETNHGSTQAVAWLRQQWDEVQSLRRSGIPVMGFTWYPLLDHVDWRRTVCSDHDHPVGLYDLNRRLRPVGDTYRKIIASSRTGESQVRKLA
jgi:beta-glucosidase